MFKIIILLSSFFSFSYGVSGCVLVQSPDVKLSYTLYDDKKGKETKGTLHGVSYTPNKPEGKNFKELFVGSRFYIDAGKNKGLSKDVEATITSIVKTDKHEKGKPRTGVMQVELIYNANRVVIPMTYTYHKGRFHAHTLVDMGDFLNDTTNMLSIHFDTSIKATLCHVDVRK